MPWQRGVSWRDRPLALSGVVDREPVHLVQAGRGVASPAFMGYPGTVVWVSGALASQQRGVAWSLDVFLSCYPEVAVVVPSTLYAQSVLCSAWKGCEEIVRKSLPPQPEREKCNRGWGSLLMKYSSGPQGRRACYFYFKETRKAAAAGLLVSPTPCYPVSPWYSRQPLFEAVGGRCFSAHRSSTPCCVSVWNAGKPGAVRVPARCLSLACPSQPLPVSPSVPGAPVVSGQLGCCTGRSSDRSTLLCAAPGLEPASARSQGVHRKRNPAELCKFKEL